MASTERRHLFPDINILSAIFPATVELESISYHVISNTFNTCTFSVHNSTLLPDFPVDVIIRLETSHGRLAAVAALQRLAHAKLPGLIPNILHLGRTTSADARQVDYCVSTYCTGTIPLEDVWDTLDKPHQAELVDSIAHAMEKLQTLRSSNSHNHTPIGGPSLGYFQDIKHFLGAILQANNQTSVTCTLLDLDDRIILESTYDDIGRVELSHLDLESLQFHVVCCHNDLEPRNILVRDISATKGKGKQFEVAALIDWEMSGFYPFAYEYGLKDIMLGSSNLSLSWYTLFKERTSFLLPQDEYHQKFIKALWVINQSKRRCMVRNVGVRFQTKWIERQQIEILDPRQGWVYKFGAEIPQPFSKDDQDVLEQEVMSELGYC